MIHLSKYIVVTGGVVSSIGKGITAASIGRILRSYGVDVTAIKIDPYLNWDSGTLNPYQHGEVFVTEDGMETDLDLGHYERFLDVNLSGKSNITTGKVYSSVINHERKGDYLGSCVQIIPHITNKIKDMVRKIAGESEAEVVLVEVGGTVGDIESQPFLEALRQLRNEEGHDNVMFVHVTYVPYLRAAGEFKTKPTQHSTKELRSTGIIPDMIICRSELSIDQPLKNKIAHFCDVDREAVINTPDVASIYEVPLIINQENVGEYIINRIKLKTGEQDLTGWEHVVESMKQDDHHVSVGIVGKYVELEDAYMSIRESLKHAAAHLGIKVDIDWIQAEETIDEEKLRHLDSILIPGGFGERGIQGKLDAVRYSLENGVPLFGICLGMQCMVVEFARLNGFDGAHSTEFDKKTPYPVIDLMEEQKKVKNMGGTMRLGSYPCKLNDGTMAKEAYGEDEVSERHRHRYELNNDYRDVLIEKGLIISGTSPDDFLVEMVELKDHPWFLGCQFHPEFKSRPNKAHPIFVSFLKASLINHKRKTGIEG
ncbi:glutamine hydrolyzing CTP synthase [Methanobacterium petrolearium]|uniref:glutamine hydrolyzing CTP synthase n=1 Tax=Methanobacterium petrolearium TaxID=710190 RepID=UPI001AE55B43|nr:CTP synthase (glutamine hydrolyzing) [Methanobacterium petrolearium]MBP1945258.1 CTP synthase [Methanobacterium petrolearium]BDZ71201.1 CTP synthetase [Methanobacterium petrolearium]